MKIKMRFNKNFNESFEVNEAFLSWHDEPIRILHEWFGNSATDMYVLKKMKRFIIRMKLVNQTKDNIMKEKEYLELFG